MAVFGSPCHFFRYLTDPLQMKTVKKTAPGAERSTVDRFQPSTNEDQRQQKVFQPLYALSLRSVGQAAKAMRLNADDFVPPRNKTVVIEIGGVHERRRSNRADSRSRLTFWPLLQQSHE